MNEASQDRYYWGEGGQGGGTVLCGVPMVPIVRCTSIWCHDTDPDPGDLSVSDSVLFGSYLPPEL